MIRIVVPYSKEVLDSVVYEYQEFFFPIQFIFIFLALLVVYLIWKSENKNNKTIVSILAIFWIWIGAIYEMKYYISINWFGLYIGSFFILQGLLLLWFGLIKKEVVFIRNNYSLLAVLILVLCYPALQIISGMHYFESSIIAMLPDITVLFFLILFFVNTQKRIWSLFIIPLVWMGFSFYLNYLLLFN